MLAVRSGAPVLPVYVAKLPGPAARLSGVRHEIFVGEPKRLDQSLRGAPAYRAAADGILRTIYALREEHTRRTTRQ
jgi:hypothetical protein